MARIGLLREATVRNELQEDQLAEGELLHKATSRNKLQEDELAKGKPLLPRLKPVSMEGETSSGPSLVKLRMKRETSSGPKLVALSMEEETSSGPDLVKFNIKEEGASMEGETRSGTNLVKMSMEGETSCGPNMVNHGQGQERSAGGRAREGHGRAAARGPSCRRTSWATLRAGGRVRPKEAGLGRDRGVQARRGQGAGQWQQGTEHAVAAAGHDQAAGHGGGVGKHRQGQWGAPVRGHNQ